MYSFSNVCPILDPLHHISQMQQIGIEMVVGREWSHSIYTVLLMTHVKKKNAFYNLLKCITDTEFGSKLSILIFLTISGLTSDDFDF